MRLLHHTGSAAALRKLDLVSVILGVIAPEVLTEDDSDIEVELENLYRELSNLQKKHAWLTFWEPADLPSSAHERWRSHLEELEFQIDDIEDEIQELENYLIGF